LIYADSSFFVSVYFADQHSRQTQVLLATDPVICVTPLHRAEWAHAVEQHVFRKTISSDDAVTLHRTFERDCIESWAPVAIPDSAFERCANLALRHVSKLGVRTLDTLHVAVALELDIDTFWTFDERQTKLAQAVGLKTN
jgi:predicted nucleic acid-binding protein